MNKQTLNLFLGAVILYCLLFGGGGSAGTTAPSFAADKLCVLVSGDFSIQGNQALDKSNPGVLPAIEKFVLANKGEYRLDDTNRSEAPAMEAPWVQAAWKVADRTHGFSIVAASPKNGIKPQALPLTPDAALKLLTPLASP